MNGATTHYTLDLNTGLTQVLSDGQREYLYGRGRVAQQNLTAAEGQREYFLGDALGSVRQLVDENGEVTLARDYQPYGETLSSSGSGTSPYGYTGEVLDPSGLVYLRARYYSPSTGRFMSRDPWQGDANMPMSYNTWLYGYANPINLTDPSGRLPLPEDPCARLPSNEQEYCRMGFQCRNPQTCPLTWPVGISKDALGYGKVFRQLLRSCPGWWQEKYDMNRNRQVTLLALALAFKWEASSYILDTKFREAMGEAMAHKYWQGFLTFNPPDYSNWFLGGRASMKNRIDEHFNQNPLLQNRPDITEDLEYEHAYKEAQKVYGIYYFQAGQNYPHRPFDWANPSSSYRSELLDGRRQGLCPQDIYLINDNRTTPQINDCTILTFDQDRCSKGSSAYACFQPCESYKQKYYPASDGDSPLFNEPWNEPWK